MLKMLTNKSTAITMSAGLCAVLAAKCGVSKL